MADDWRTWLVLAVGLLLAVVLIGQFAKRLIAWYVRRNARKIAVEVARQTKDSTVERLKRAYKALSEKWRPRNRG